MRGKLLTLSSVKLKLVRSLDFFIIFYVNHHEHSNRDSFSESLLFSALIKNLVFFRVQPLPGDNQGDGQVNYQVTENRCNDVLDSEIFFFLRFFLYRQRIVHSLVVPREKEIQVNGNPCEIRVDFEDVEVDRLNVVTAQNKNPQVYKMRKCVIGHMRYVVAVDLNNFQFSQIGKRFVVNFLKIFVFHENSFKIWKCL